MLARAYPLTLCLARFNLVRQFLYPFLAYTYRKPAAALTSAAPAGLGVKEQAAQLGGQGDPAGRARRVLPRRLHVIRYRHRLNMELYLQSLFGLHVT